MVTDECRSLVESGTLKPREGSIRIFVSPVAEALTRSPPWLPFVWIPPVVAVVVEHHEMHASFLAGMGAWFMLEYLLHRFFFHLPGESNAARGVRFLAHEHHHAFPHDRTRIVATPWQLALGLLLVAPFARLGPAPWLTLSGTLCAYLIYEAIHFRIHHGTTHGRVMRGVRAHHLRHHAPEGSRAAFGISSPLLDYVFGTRRAP